MRAIQKLRHLVRSFVASSRVESELDEELRYHIDRQIDLFRKEGLSDDEARFRALREFGGVDQRKEECRDARGLGIVETVTQDVRYAWRTLRRTPGFALLGVIVMALGIGANTAIFTLLDQVLLRPLPVREPDRLVRLRWDGEFSAMAMSDDSLSYPFYRDVRDRTRLRQGSGGQAVFSGVLCRFKVPLSVSRRERNELVDGELVSGNYFDVLGVAAAAGRTFRESDDRVAGAHPVAVLSYDYWVSRFNADPAAIGQPITIGGLPFTIVGVSERGFDGVELGYSPKIRVPIAMKVPLTHGFFAEYFNLENRRAFWLQAFARLAPGVDRGQAQAAVQPFFRSILTEELSDKGFEHVAARTKRDFLRSTLALDPGSQGRSSLRDDYTVPLRVLMAMVALILLLACANLANLILERALSRRKEIAVRLALGARPGHIVRQVLAESLLVSLAGAAAGWFLAMVIGDWLVAFVPFESLGGDQSLAFDASPNPRVLAFTLVLSVATGLLFGLAPALAARRTNLTSAIGREGRGVTGSHVRLRQTLVIAQVALSVLLLYAAGQFVQTLRNLRHVDTGLHIERVLAFSVNPSLNGYDKERSRAFYRELMARVHATPGVESAGAAAIRLLSGDWWATPITFDIVRRDATERPHALCNLVSAGFLSTMGIPLRAGRDFVAADADRPESVGLVNETFVRRYFGGRSPIGRRVALGDAPGTVPNILIVGVIGDTKYSSMRDEISPQLLLNDDQNTDIQSTAVYVRTAMDPASVYASIRSLVHGIDRSVPVFDMRTVKDQAEVNMLRERMLASLATAFGALATALAAVGIYALIAFNVTRKMREIGVRVALGADVRAVVWLILREVLWLVTIAVAMAVPIAWALARLVASQFYGVPPMDPATTGAAVVLLLTIALLAGYLPARRATHIDPIEVLRAE